MFGVLAVQESARVEVVGLPALKLPGAVGAVGTFTVAVEVAVPFAFVAVIVYVVVVVGFTMSEPMSVLVEKLPGVIATDDAFVMFHESVLAAPGAITVGDAEKEDMEGNAPFVVVPLALVEVAQKVPTPLYAETAYV